MYELDLTPSLFSQEEELLKSLDLPESPDPWSLDDFADLLEPLRH